LAFLAVWSLVGCGGTGSSTGSRATTTPAVERPVPTAGDGLLGALPEDADAVVELDLRRVRAHEMLGPALAQAAPALRGEVPSGGLSIDPLVEADLVVAAVYELAGAQPTMVVLVRGEFDAAAVVAASPDTAVVDERTLVFAPPLWREAVLACVAGEAPALGADAEFRALRDQAMPARAPGAALRVTARLGRDARIAAANQLGVDQVPATVSLWLDVVDDLAMVALLGADDDSGAAELARAVERAARELARERRWRRLFQRVTARAEGTEVRVVWYVGPKALRKTFEE
jgi:hypothetical protein